MGRWPIGEGSLTVISRATVLAGRLSKRVQACCGVRRLDTALPNLLDCGGKRSATPLWSASLAVESGVVASLCHRSPKSSCSAPIPPDSGTLTVAVYGGALQSAHSKPFLKPGAFHHQQIQLPPLVSFDARLGALTPDKLNMVWQTLVQLLSLEA